MGSDRASLFRSRVRGVLSGDSLRLLFFLRFGAFSWFERKRPWHRLLGSGVGVGSMDRVRFMRPLSGKSVRCAGHGARGACGARGALPCRSADRWVDAVRSATLPRGCSRRGSVATNPVLAFRERAGSLGSGCGGSVAARHAARTGAQTPLHRSAATRRFLYHDS